VGTPEEIGLARLERLLERLAIHIAKDQHLAGFVVLENDGNEPVVVPFESVEVHCPS
jgi:hypothetical protein